MKLIGFVVDVLFFMFTAAALMWLLGVFIDGAWPLSQDTKNIIVFGSVCLALGFRLARK